MKGAVVVMSGPAIRALKAENATYREQNRLLKRVLVVAEEGSRPDNLESFDDWVKRLRGACAAARELIP